jgi:hypothetical protein
MYKNLPKEYGERICEECGVTYTAKASNSMTCSRECSEKRRMRKIKEENSLEKKAIQKGKKVTTRYCLKCDVKFKTTEDYRTCPNCRRAAGNYETWDLPASFRGLL